MLRFMTRKASCMEIKRAVCCTRESFRVPLSIPYLRSPYFISSRESSDNPLKSETINFQVIEEESKELLTPEILKLEGNECAQTKKPPCTINQSGQNKNINLIGNSSITKERELGSHDESQAVGLSIQVSDTVNIGSNQGIFHHSRKRGRKPKSQKVELPGLSTSIDNGTTVETSAKPKKRGPKPKPQKAVENGSPENIDNNTTVEILAQPKKRGRKPKSQKVELPGLSTSIDNGTTVEILAQPKKRGPKPKSQKAVENRSPENIDNNTTVEILAQPKKRGPKPKSLKKVKNISQNIRDMSLGIGTLGRETSEKELENRTDSGISPVGERAWNAARKSDIESDWRISFIEEATINTKSDLIKYLSTISNAKRGTKKLLLENRKYDVTNRVNIIDSKLCDEALQRLAPSLEKHKGCDIIDLNPGVGVWSSKLHDFLQPRSHILMEPHPNSYVPALKTLLDAPFSKYRIVPENGMSWAHLERILSPKYLPFQPILKHGDPELERPNNTLLVTANISDYHSRRFLGFGSVGSVVVYQFLSAIRSHALFQHYGKVRMLLWMNSDDTRVIPRNLAGQKKTAMEALVSCDHIETVVDSDENRRHCSREKRLDIERVRSVVENMKRKGIEIPKGRETHILKELRSGATGSEIEELSPKSLQRSLQEMNDSFARGDFEKNCLPEEDSHDELHDSKRRKLPKKTPEYERMRELARRNKRRVSKTQRLSDLADDYGNILALYRQSYLSKCPTEAQALQIQARYQTNIWRENLSTLAPADSAEIQYICDSRRSYSQDPPGMFWDRREFEPLRASPDDFYPKKTLSLLDFRPVLTPFFSENPAYQDIISYLIMQLCLVPSQNLKQALDSLAPGALEWLVAECPSLTNPLKNGCPDLELFSARCVTVEMLTEMTKAWLRWPFRPHRDEILHRLGSEAFSDQTEPE